MPLTPLEGRWVLGVEVFSASVGRGGSFVVVKRYLTYAENSNAHETFILRTLTTRTLRHRSASSKSVVLHVGLEVTSIVYQFDGGF